jgi:hypothetical protein
MGTRREPLRFVCRGCGQPGETWSTSNKGIYHSKACRAAAERTGNLWRYQQGGYWMLSWNDAGTRRFQFEHRRVWENAHGPIPAGFVVHHLNEDKLDNRLENLHLLRRSDHTYHHKRDTLRYRDGATSADYQREHRRRKGAIAAGRG